MIFYCKQISVSIRKIDFFYFYANIIIIIKSIMWFYWFLLLLFANIIRIKIFDKILGAKCLFYEGNISKVQVIYMCVTAPLVEEIIFRFLVPYAIMGYLLWSSYYSRMISNILFTIAHFLDFRKKTKCDDLWKTYTICTNVFFVFIFTNIILYADNFIYGCVMHIIYNTTTIAVIYFLKRKKTFIGDTNNQINKVFVYTTKLRKSTSCENIKKSNVFTSSESKLVNAKSFELWREMSKKINEKSGKQLELVLRKKEK